MNITKAWLEERRACEEGRVWWGAQKESDSLKVLKKLLKLKKFNWFSWLAPRLMSRSQKVEWSVFCAEQVLHIYEQKYPEKDAPRKAIEAAKNWLKNPCEETNLAAAAAYAAATAAATAAAADAAAYAAAAYAAAASASAASAAAADADADAYAAYAYAYADADAYAAAASASAAREKVRTICANEAINIISR